MINEEMLEGEILLSVYCSSVLVVSHPQGYADGGLNHSHKHG